MGKQTLTIALAAIALVVPLAGQKGKPPKPQAYTPCTFAGEVDSGDALVSVGRDVATYGPAGQALYIHGSLLPESDPANLPGVVAQLKATGHDGQFYGPYYGQIRMLDDRLDYWFDTAPGCYQNKAPLCPFRVVVVDGTAVYERSGKTRTLVRIAFNDGRYLLDYRPCDPAVDPVNCYFKLLGCYDDRDCPSGVGYVYASFEARF